MINNIGLDTRMINNSGIGTTIREFLDHSSNEQLKKLTLFGREDDTDQYPTTTVGVSYPIYSLRQHGSYAHFLNHQDIDLFHMPHFDVPLFLNKPFIMTIHDLIHIKFPQYSTKPMSRLYAKYVLTHAAQKARKIFVVSQNTKNDLIELLPDTESKIVITYPGVSKHFKHISDKESNSSVSKYHLPKEYLLYVGNIRPSKNSERLIKSYLKTCEIYRDLPKLVLVGKNFYKNPIRHEKLIYTGVVSNDDLPAIYSQAMLFIFPSLYEGFGLPILEAMACDTPVISSSAASLPEVAGDAARLINPQSEEDISTAIVEVVLSATQRNIMKKRGMENIKKFTWENYTQTIWKEYEAALQ